MSTEGIQHITDMALAQFTSALRGNRDYEWLRNVGAPPSKGYVEQKRFSREPWCNGPALAAWQIENYDLVSKVEPLVRLPKPLIDGMFFDCLIGNWGVESDLKSLSINWPTGPRFGRGFVFPILEAPTGVLYLGSPESSWVS